MFAFGGVAVETIIIYPNVFEDAPESLARATEFFRVTGPADLFPPLGALTIGTAILSLVAVWAIRRARTLIIASMVSLVFGEFLFSLVYFWPRNEIMFGEGASARSAEELQRAATEFEIGHWFRLAMSAVTATLAFVAMLRCYQAATVTERVRA